MKRGEILDTAKSYVTKDRAATHGDAESSFAKIGEMWGALLGVPVAADKVALMMAALKIVRAWNTPKHGDNWVDLAGYAACGGEIALHDNGQLELPLDDKKSWSQVLKDLFSEVDFGKPVPAPVEPEWIEMKDITKKIEIEPGQAIQFKFSHGGIFTHRNNTNEIQFSLGMNPATHYRVVRL